MSRSSLLCRGFDSKRNMGSKMSGWRRITREVVVPPAHTLFRTRSFRRNQLTVNWQYFCIVRWCSNSRRRRRHPTITFPPSRGGSDEYDDDLRNSPSIALVVASPPPPPPPAYRGRHKSDQPPRRPIVVLVVAEYQHPRTRGGEGASGARIAVMR